jgi:hypothetical protein
MKQLTEKQAIAFSKSGVWKNWTDEEVVKFQLYQDRLCLDFSRFHQAMEGVLGRPVFTHEFAFSESLVEEYEGKRPTPTFGEIINLIPVEKRILIGV